VANEKELKEKLIQMEQKLRGQELNLGIRNVRY